MSDALKVACEIISPDPAGGSARIDIKVFNEMYVYLTEVDGEVPKKQVENVMDFLNMES